MFISFLKQHFDFTILDFPILDCKFILTNFINYLDFLTLSYYLIILFIIFCIILTLIKNLIFLKNISNEKNKFYKYLIFYNFYLFLFINFYILLLINSFDIVVVIQLKYFKFLIFVISIISLYFIYIFNKKLFYFKISIKLVFFFIFCISGNLFFNSFLNTDILLPIVSVFFNPFIQCDTSYKTVIISISLFALVGISYSFLKSYNDILKENDQYLIKLRNLEKLKLSVVLPKEDVALPKEDVALPKEDVVLPKKEAILPKKEAILPKKEAILPNKEAVLPNKEAVLPKKEAALPKKEAVLPKKEAALPKKEAVLPKEKVVLPKEESNSLKLENAHLRDQIQRIYVTLSDANSYIGELKKEKEEIKDKNFILTNAYKQLKKLNQDDQALKNTTITELTKENLKLKANVKDLLENNNNRILNFKQFMFNNFSIKPIVMELRSFLNEIGFGLGIESKINESFEDNPSFKNIKISIESIESIDNMDQNLLKNEEKKDC